MRSPIHRTRRQRLRLITTDTPGGHRPPITTRRLDEHSGSSRGTSPGLLISLERLRALATHLPTRNGYSPNRGINETILWLIDQGMPPIPIAPAHSAILHPMKRQDGTVITDREGKPLPRFCGKNPSYINRRGYPRLVQHKRYHDTLPTQDELKEWFGHPRTGVGTLGGWGGVLWVDIDAKLFDSPDDCAQIIECWLEFIPELKQTYFERTCRGGYHLAVRCIKLPTWSRIAFSPGGQHIGEVLKQGLPIVLAPTIGVNGQPYQVICRADPICIEQLESISIYSTQKAMPIQRVAYQTTRRRRFLTDPTTCDLEWLFCQRVSNLISSLNPDVDDRSSVLAQIAHEAFGWEAIAQQHYTLMESAESICYRHGRALGLDDNRIARIINSSSGGIPIRNSPPALWHHGGQDKCVRVMGSRVRWRSRKG